MDAYPYSKKRTLIPYRAGQLLFLLTLTCCNTFAQTNSVSGRIVDAESNDPLSFANVFIDRTTIGTAADVDGYFKLNGLPAGELEIIFSFVGYNLGKKKINVKGETDIGTITLEQAEEKLNEVEIQASRDKKWQRHLERFERIFIGSGQLSKSCSIQNPWVINFEEEDGQIIVSADHAIQIRNEHLGYLIYFYLDKTRIDRVGYHIKGNIRFVELITQDDRQALAWMENRHNAYFGSARHLFKSIIEQKIHGEGFNLYEDIGEGQTSIGNYLTASDNFRLLLGTALTQKDTTGLLLPGNDSCSYRIKLDKRLEVHYRYARAPVRAYTDIGYPVSWLLAKGGYIHVKKDGSPVNGRDLMASGAMIRDWVATMLPENYEPPKKLFSGSILTKELWAQLREKVYVHTDKPYYYPGETIWFKAYINQEPPQLVDSLSKTMHLNFFNSTGDLLIEKNLRIEQRAAISDITLPDSLKAGTYYIRLFTNFQRNFGDSNLYTIQVPVIDLMDRVIGPVSEILEADTAMVLISSQKETYGVREKITLSIHVADALSGPLSANLSVAVTDLNQVRPIDGQSNILEGYPLTGYPEGNVTKMNFPVEQGIAIGGKIFSKRKKPVSGTVSILDFDSKDMTLLQADKNGEFKLNDLNFYGSHKLLIQATDRKNRELDNIKIINREVPPLRRLNNLPKFKVVSTSSPQRILTSYEKPEDVRMLGEITVTSKKIEDAEASTYGKADYVLKGENIETSYGNLILAIRGQFPGLIVRQAPTDYGLRWVIYSTRGASLKYGREVLVTLNDVAVAGAFPADFIQTIDPTTVDRIEFTSRMNTSYGAQGAFGVLSIYTKKGLKREPKKTEEPHFLTVDLAGYSVPKKFKFPVYDNNQGEADPIDANFRSTIYWNPQVITNRETGEASVTFYAADLPTSYAVTIEGVTYDNRPVRGTYKIDIAK